MDCWYWFKSRYINYGKYHRLFYILHYVKKVKKVKNDPSQSLIFFAKQENINHFFKSDMDSIGKLDRKVVIILTLFFGTFVTMVYGAISLQ